MMVWLRWGATSSSGALNTGGGFEHLAGCPTGKRSGSRRSSTGNLVRPAKRCCCQSVNQFGKTKSKLTFGSSS